MRPRLRLVVVSVVLCATTGACGDNENAGTNTAAATAATGTAANPTEGGFCEAMAHLIVLLSPTDAPAAIAGDVAAYKTAYDEYVRYLSTVDFNLNIVFSTPQGTQLAIDTSHTLTPAIVQYAVDDCGLSFGDEQQPPSSTT